MSAPRTPSGRAVLDRTATRRWRSSSSGAQTPKLRATRSSLSSTPAPRGSRIRTWRRSGSAAPTPPVPQSKSPPGQWLCSRGSEWMRPERSRPRAAHAGRCGWSRSEDAPMVSPCRRAAERRHRWRWVPFPSLSATPVLTEAICWAGCRGTSRAEPGRCGAPWCPTASPHWTRFAGQRWIGCSAATRPRVPASCSPITRSPESWHSRSPVRRRPMPVPVAIYCWPGPKSATPSPIGCPASATSPRRCTAPESPR